MLGQKHVESLLDDNAKFYKKVLWLLLKNDLINLYNYGIRWDQSLVLSNVLYDILLGRKSLLILLILSII